MFGIENRLNDLFLILVFLLISFLVILDISPVLYSHEATITGPAEDITDVFVVVDIAKDLKHFMTAQNCQDVS